MVQDSLLPMPESDSRLLAAAHAGNAAALGSLFQRVRAYLRRTADQELDPELRTRGDRSDLVQETFLEATKRFPSFHGRTLARLQQ